MNVTITGKAVVITANLTLDNLKKLRKYRPEALKLRNEQGTSVFAIDTTPGCGKINDYGIEFSDVTYDPEGRATCTIIADDSDVEKVKTAVADSYGGTLLNLQELELKLPDIIAEMNQERERLLSAIEVR